MATSETGEAQVIGDVLARLFESYGVVKVAIERNPMRDVYIYSIPVADYRRILAISDEYIQDTPDGFANRLAQMQDLGIYSSLLACPKDQFVLLVTGPQTRLVALPRISTNAPW